MVYRETIQLLTTFNDMVKLDFCMCFICWQFVKMAIQAVVHRCVVCTHLKSTSGTTHTIKSHSHTEVLHVQP